MPAEQKCCRLTPASSTLALPGAAGVYSVCIPETGSTDLVTPCQGNKVVTGAWQVNSRVILGQTSFG